MTRISALLFCAAALAADWTQPAVVFHEDKPCVSYRARLAGDYVVVEAAIEAGWHTFSMDNDRRALEKLAGKKSLGIDQPTKIAVTGGLEVVEPWRQLPPKDFSKPELRWFSWGYEDRGLFAAKVRRTGAGPAQIGIKGQACSEATCRNVDVSIALPVVAGQAVDLKSLIALK